MKYLGHHDGIGKIYRLMDKVVIANELSSHVSVICNTFAQDLMYKRIVTSALYPIADIYEAITRKRRIK